MRRTYWILLIVLVAVALAACAPEPASSPEVVVTQINVTVVAPTAVPTDTPEPTPTPEAFMITVGNQDFNPGKDSLDCYTQIEAFADHVLDDIGAGVQLSALGRSDDYNPGWIAVEHPDQNEVCWLYVNQLTLPEGVDWEDLPVYP